MKNNRIAVALIWFLLLSLGSAVRAGAQDRDDFSNESLNGRYGFHVLALSLNLPDVTTGASVPFAVSGYYKFNGDGTLSGEDTVSTQGVIVPRSYAGKYHVNADGTGTLVLFISPTFHPAGNFTMVADGEEIEIIFAVPGNLNTFTLRKQHAH